MFRISLGGLFPLLMLAGCATSNPFAGLTKRGNETPSPLFGDSQQSTAAKPATKKPFGLGLRESSEVAQSIEQGETAENEGRLEEARGLYERALTFDPDNSRAHHRLATIHDRREDYVQAARHYRAALKKSPKSADILSDLGYSCQLQGNDEQSEQHLREALKYDPKHRQALYNLGNLYARHGRPDDALSLYRRAGSEDEAQAALAQANSSSMGVRTAAHHGNASRESFAEATAPAPAPSGGVSSSRSYPNTATRKLAEDYERRKAESDAMQRRLRGFQDAQRRDPNQEYERQLRTEAEVSRIQGMIEQIDREQYAQPYPAANTRRESSEILPASGQMPPTGRGDSWNDMAQPGTNYPAGGTGQWSNEIPRNSAASDQPMPPASGNWSTGAASPMSPAERAARMGLSAGAGSLSIDDGQSSGAAVSAASGTNSGAPAGFGAPAATGWGQSQGWSQSQAWNSSAPAPTNSAAVPGWSRQPATGAGSPGEAQRPAGWSTAPPAGDAQSELQKIEAESLRLQQRQAELREQLRRSSAAPGSQAAAPPVAPAGASAAPGVDIRPGVRRP